MTTSSALRNPIVLAAALAGCAIVWLVGGASSHAATAAGTVGIAPSGSPPSQASAAPSEPTPSAPVDVGGVDPRASTASHPGTNGAVDAAAVAASVVEAGYIAYPDGSRLPPLNGVKIAPAILFHRMAPFARVVGKMTDASGREWYVHENGVRSTTCLETKDGVTTAVGHVAMAVRAAPAIER